MVFELKQQVLLRYYLNTYISSAGIYRIACLVNFQQTDILKYFSFSPEERIWREFAWNVKACFLGQIRKNAFSLSSAV